VAIVLGGLISITGPGQLSGAELKAIVRI